MRVSRSVTHEISDSDSVNMRPLTSAPLNCLTRELVCPSVTGPGAALRWAVASSQTTAPFISSRYIAPAGHLLTHSPQKMHREPLTCGDSCPAGHSIAPVGQTLSFPCAGNSESD